MSKGMVFGVPVKKKIKKVVQSEPENCNGPVNPDYLDLTIRISNNNEIVGTDGYQNYLILDPSKVNIGEVWNCMIALTGGGPVKMREAIPVTLVHGCDNLSDDSADDAEPVSETIEETAAQPAEAADERYDTLLKQYEELKAKLKEKNEKLGLANLKIGRQEKQLSVIPKLRQEITDNARTITSLKTQVKQLEGKVKKPEEDRLRSEAEHYKKLYESQNAIIDQLREVVALYESGTSTRPTTVSTYLTGPTGLHCNLLDDGCYKVYFSPGRKTLRFVSDEDGMVDCRNHEVTIPAIGYFSSFEKIRVLDTVREGDEVVVSLG